MFNPKHVCLRGEAQRKADTTQTVGEDIIILVATFASCRDLCTLGCVCRRFAPLPARKSLWELRALDILPSRPRLLSAMSELRITSYRQLVEAFTKIGIPGGVLGFWRAEKPSRSSAAQLEFSSRLSPPGREGPTVEEEARGELLRISLAAGRFQCDSIAPNGSSRCIFTIRILPNANQTVSIQFFSMEGVNPPATPSNNWIPGQGSGRVPVPTASARTPIRPSGEKAFFLNRGGGRTCRFIKLKAPTPPPLPPTASSAPTAAAVAQSLCGLCSAFYGNHGLEIIQLSLDPCSAASGAPPPSSGGAAAAGQAEEAELGRGAGARAGLSKAEGRSRATFSSSGKTSGSESVCTSAPATESEGGFGGSCGSVASGSVSGSASGSVSGSDAEEEEDGDGGGGEMFRSRRVRRARAAATNKGGCFGSETDEGEEEKESDYHKETGGGGRRAQSRFAAGRGGAAAVSDGGGGGGDSLRQPQLIGVKVTGDANVPAGKTSFAIDLEGHCDVDAELEADRRPVVLFLPSGALMANLANRRGQISFWRKGRGQINRVPGRWSPEWVDVDFVAYKAGFSRAFSVVFRQPTQAVRVMMDFERALGSKEEWPQWPASAVPVHCRS